MGDSIETEEDKLEENLLKKFASFNGFVNLDYRQAEALKKEIEKFFKKYGKTTPRLLDVLRILELYEKDYVFKVSEDLYSLALTTVKRLEVTDLENWNYYDIFIADQILTYTESVEVAEKLAYKNFKAIKLFSKEDKVNKLKFNTHFNISHRLLFAEFFEFNTVDDRSMFKNLFKHHTSKALKMCELDGEIAKKYELMVFIKIALWDKDSDEVMKNLSLFKNVATRRNYKILRHEIALFSDFKDFELNDSQMSLFIGDNIRKMRERQNIEVADVSEKLGVTDSHLNAVERGENNLSIHKLLELSKILNTRVDVLCYGKNR